MFLSAKELFYLEICVDIPREYSKQILPTEKLIKVQVIEHGKSCYLAN